MSSPAAFVLSAPKPLSCQMRARSGGRFSPCFLDHEVQRYRDRVIALPGRVLVDHGGASAAVPYTRHEFLQAGLLPDECRARVPEIVQVQVRVHLRRLQSLLPHTVEVPPLWDATLRTDEQTPVRTRLSEHPQVLGHLRGEDGSDASVGSVASALWWTRLKSPYTYMPSPVVPYTDTWVFNLNDNERISFFLDELNSLVDRLRVLVDRQNLILVVRDPATAVQDLRSSREHALGFRQGGDHEPPAGASGDEGAVVRIVRDSARVTAPGKLMFVFLPQKVIR